MRNLVPIQGRALHPTGRLRLDHNCLGNLGGSFLVVCRIAGQFGENVLIDQLLDNPLSCFNLVILLLVRAATVGLLGVVSTALHALFRVGEDERLEELDRSVHRLVI